MLQVKVMSAKDYGFAVNLANTMNWNMIEQDFKFNQLLEPNGCFMLFDGSVPVGVATCISFGKVGWFGNFIIKPEHRGQGAGGFLLEHSLKYLQSKSVETIGLYSYPPLEGVYRKFGFKTDLGFSVMCNDNLQIDRLSSSKFEGPSDFSLVTRFDEDFFGANRALLLDGIVQDKVNRCYVSMSAGVVEGYVLVKVWGGVVEVGPLVCCLNKPEVALRLLRVALEGLRGRSVLLYVPVGFGFEGVLLGLGFRKEFSLLRMFLGEPKIQRGIHIAESLERG